MGGADTHSAVTLSASLQLFLTCHTWAPGVTVQVSEVASPEQVCVNSNLLRILIFTDFGLSLAFLRATQSIKAILKEFPYNNSVL